MRAIQTLIVDDEPLARSGIASLLRADPEIAIVGESSSGIEAIAHVRSLRPELVFLDVQMPGCDGFEVLESLGSDAPPAIVFVTAYDRYAVRAFEAEALDYLLKPYDDARFLRVLARAKAHFANRSGNGVPGDRIVVRNAGRVSFVHLDEIDWIEAADYYACLHAGARTHLLRRSMAELEQDLGSKNFCRIHRSTIVNLARITDLLLDASGEYETLLRDGTRLKVSRGFRENLQQRLSRTV